MHNKTGAVYHAIEMLEQYIGIRLDNNPIYSSVQQEIETCIYSVYIIGLSKAYSIPYLLL